LLKQVLNKSLVNNKCTSNLGQITILYLLTDNKKGP
jgi:hypothetical protein